MKHLWVPFALILALMGVRFLILWLLPETSSSRTGIQAACEENQRMPAPTVLPEGSTESPEYIDNAEDQFIDLRTSEGAYPRIWKHIYDLIQRPQIQFCFLAVFLRRIAISSEALLYQYASDVLSITLSKTAWIRALRSIGATLVTGIGVPVAMRLLTRQRDQTSSTATFMIVQGSLTILSAGFITLWLGHTSVVIGIGKCRLPILVTINEY